MKVIKLTKTLALLISFFILGCSDDIGKIIYSTGVNISVKNATGEDLLDPQIPVSFKEEMIKTYYLVNGEERLADTEEFIYEDAQGIYRLRVFLNYEGTDEFPITYIDWHETDRDTIKSEFYKTDTKVIVTKIWFNNELKWNHENGGDPEFTIVK